MKNDITQEKEKLNKAKLINVDKIFWIASVSLNFLFSFYEKTEKIDHEYLGNWFKRTHSALRFSFSLRRSIRIIMKNPL